MHPPPGWGGVGRGSPWHWALAILSLAIYLNLMCVVFVVVLLKDFMLQLHSLMGTGATVESHCLQQWGHGHP